ncbi:hypothetical protein BZY94_20965 [Burkholderia territorii]|nr:hypothetical protein BZY94_20965 [Burkholderia territorii]
MFEDGGLAAEGLPSERQAILLRGATILSMDTDNHDYLSGDILIEGSIITAVASSIVREDAFVIDCRGMVAIPGFQDTHRHSWEGQLRRIMPSGTMVEYVRTTHAGFAPHYEPYDMYVGNLLTAVHCIDAGITGVLDYSHNSQTLNHVDAALQALSDVGIRGVFACGAPSALNPSAGTCTWPDAVAEIASRDIVQNNPLITLRMAGTPGTLDQRHFALANQLGIGVSVDAVAGPQSAAWILCAEKAGWLGPNRTLIHCTGLDNAAWDVIYRTQTTVSLCPHADMHYMIHDGVPPLTQALRSGVRPSISIDDDAGLSSDMWTQMRLLLSSQRQGIATRRQAGGDDESVVTVFDMLEFATLQGARANGLGTRCGRLVPGLEADIVLLRVDDMLTMPLNNAYGSVVLGADTRSVDTVIIGGAIRKFHGSLVGVNIDALRDAVNRSRDRLLAARRWILDPLSRSA